MLRGSLTGYMDVAQVTLYAFFIFFAGLILYLRREDKREGYPLETDPPQRGVKQGFPDLPRPKFFRLPHGGTYAAPGRPGDRRDLKLVRSAPWPGSPFLPSGNPMQDGVGPGSYVEREDAPELMMDGKPMIVPLASVPEVSVAADDPDPRGFAVVGADGKVAGTVAELWIDMAEPQVRYLEVKLAGDEGGRTVILPITFATVRGRRRRVEVPSILASQFAGVPAIKGEGRITKLEEDKISAYYASGELYATPGRLGPLL